MTARIKQKQKTFADVYNKSYDTKAPTSRQERNKLIVAEMEKYKPNMDLKFRKPFRYRVALCIVLISMAIFVAYRIMHSFDLDPFTMIYGILVTYVIVQSLVVSYLFYKDPAQAPRKNDHHPLVSVVIACKNEPYLLYDSVESCLTQSYRNLEVIIVDDGSDDGVTPKAMDDIAAASHGRVRVRHLERNMGKRVAMAEGVKNIPDAGELVVFLDSDTIIEHDAVARLVTCMVNDDNLGAIVGYCRALNSTNALSKMQDTWYSSAFTIGKGMEASLGQSVSCCSGILSCYRKEAILPCIDAWAHDRFLGIDFMAGDDRQLTAYVLGGNKYTIDKNLKQWKTGYCESAISVSEVPTTLRKFVRQQIRWEQSWTRVFLFTAPWYFRGRHPLATIDYYLRMGLSYFAPIIAIINLVIAPLTGHWESALVYLLGLGALSMLFAMDFKLYNPDSGKKWMWRVLFTFVSVGTLYFLLYYSVYSIKKNDWLTR